jgi:hypothetical protein
MYNHVKESMFITSSQNLLLIFFYFILLQKKSDPVVRSPVYEAPEIFKTSNFFPPDEDTTSDS